MSDRMYLKVICPYCFKETDCFYCDDWATTDTCKHCDNWFRIEMKFIAKKLKPENRNGCDKRW